MPLLIYFRALKDYFQHKIYFRDGSGLSEKCSLAETAFEGLRSLLLGDLAEALTSGGEVRAS